VTINAPILSVDYSLAPQAPFPRALEEIFYAYCWAIENLSELGTTGESIVLAGDSAGSNLISALTVKLIEEGIQLPHGIVNLYGIFNVDFMISPSAALSLIDPILPFGVTSNLIKSYGMDREITDLNGNIVENVPEKLNFVFRKSIYLSPYQASDEILRQFPPTRFVVGILDPLNDDSVEFGKKLRALNVDVEINFLHGLYHGFLYFIQVRDKK
jgi:hormone-sensitive lipase